jgi:hypothetical protein
MGWKGRESGVASWHCWDELSIDISWPTICLVLVFFPVSQPTLTATCQSPPIPNTLRAELICHCASGRSFVQVR